MTEVLVQLYLMCLAFASLGEFFLLFDVGDSICSNNPDVPHPPALCKLCRIV